MTDANLIRFTLSDGTDVSIKKVANNKYDFELQLLNGNRKTFVWSTDMINFFENKKDNQNQLVFEAIKKLKAVINDQPY